MGSPLNELGRPPVVLGRENELQHEVRVTRAFALKTTEVTQGEWHAVMGSRPSHFAACGENCPVESISFSDAKTFVNRLSRAEGLPTCYGPDGSFAGLACLGYRLPTEAEWEYAARAGSRTAFHSGEIQSIDCARPDMILDLAGWYCGNAAVAYEGCIDLNGQCLGVSPVGQKQPNAWGLFDTHGNVSEWVHDGFAPYPEAPVVDPTGPEAAESRVLRGGSWRDDARYARSAARLLAPSDPRGSTFGLRPARTLP